MENSTTLNEVLALAGRLPPIDKVRLIEWVAPQIERDWLVQAVDRADDRPLADVSSTPGDYAAILTDSDHVPEQIAQWQTQYAVQPEDSVATLHQLREARDADFDYLR
jgi:hypothetical protein